MRKLLVPILGALALAALIAVLLATNGGKPKTVTTIPKPPGWAVWATVGGKATYTDTAPTKAIVLPVSYVWATVNGVLVRYDH